MDKRPTGILIVALRACRIGMHLLYGALLAIIYPHLAQVRQRRILKNWSRYLLTILNVGIQIEGPQLARAEGGCMLVANHVSWLDIFVLNAIYPSLFIAKSEVRDWPLIGWLCRRSGTIFIERAMRQNTSLINQHVSLMLKQGACIGLFPEGTTTDGKQVAHFHSALIQPAIDAGARLCPIALRYQDEMGTLSTAAAFTGDMTLTQSIWKILRCPQLNALVVFTPALMTANKNRRVLARAAQQAIEQGLIDIAAMQPEPETEFAIPNVMLSAQSAYVLLLDPVINHLPK